MSRRWILLGMLILVLSVSCRPQAAAHMEIATPPTATPTLPSLPVHETFMLRVQIYCGPHAAGVVFTAPNGRDLTLCFEEPGFFEAYGGMDYFLLFVTNEGTPHLQVLRHGTLARVLPTATPVLTLTPGATSRPLPLSIRTLTPAGPAPLTPVTVRTIQLDVKGYC